MQTTSEVKLIKRHAVTRKAVYKPYLMAFCLRTNKQKQRLCLCCYFVIVIAFNFKQEFEATAKLFIRQNANNGALWMSGYITLQRDIW